MYFNLSKDKPRISVKQMEYAENKSHFLQLKKSWKSKHLGATFESQQWILEEGWKTPTAGRMKLEKKGGKESKSSAYTLKCRSKVGELTGRKTKKIIAHL